MRSPSVAKRPSVPSLMQPSPGQLCSERCARVRHTIRSLRYVDNLELGFLAKGRAQLLS